MSWTLAFLGGFASCRHGRAIAGYVLYAADVGCSVAGQPGPSPRRRAEGSAPGQGAAAAQASARTDASMDEIGEPGQHAGVGFRQHAMTQVEHVPLGSATAGQDIPGALLDASPRRPASAPGQGSCSAYPLCPPDTSSSQIRKSTPTTWHPPLPHQPEQLARSDSEVDTRQPGGSERREGVGLVSGGSAAPGSRKDFARHPTSRTASIAEPATWICRNEMVMSASRPSSACHSSGLPSLGALGLSLTLQPLTLQVEEQAGLVEGAAHEASQRALAQLGHERLHRLGHVGHVIRAQLAQPPQVRPRSAPEYSTTGPIPALRSTSMPTARRGTTMSLNKMAASTSYRRKTAQGDFRDQLGPGRRSSVGMPSRTRRYSGSDRPACRMNQTGV